MSFLPLDPIKPLLRECGFPPRTDAEREDPWRHLQNILVDVYKGIISRTVFNKLRASGLVQVMADMLRGFESIMNTPLFRLKYESNREHFLDWRIICRVMYRVQVLLPPQKGVKIQEREIMHDVLSTVLNIALFDPRFQSSEPRAVDARDKLVYFLEGIVEDTLVIRDDQISRIQKDRIRAIAPVLATVWRLAPLSTPIPESDETAALDEAARLLCLAFAFSLRHGGLGPTTLQTFLGLSPDDFLAAYFRISGSPGLPRASLAESFQLLFSAINFDKQCDPQKPLSVLWKAKVTDYLEQTQTGGGPPLSSLSPGERELKEAEAYWHIAMERDVSCTAPTCRRYWGLRGEPLLQCSRCRTYYCSVACQRSHWKAHKKDCLRSKT